MHKNYINQNFLAQKFKYFWLKNTRKIQFFFGEKKSFLEKINIAKNIFGENFFEQEKSIWVQCDYRRKL